MNETDDTVHQVYFPLKGMLSLLAVLGDGKAIETATVGRESFVNAMTVFGLSKSTVRVVVQIPLEVAVISATRSAGLGPKTTGATSTIMSRPNSSIRLASLNSM